MTVVVETQQLVDPQRLLVVAYRDGDRQHEVVAVSCRYVPAVDATGRRAVAIEIVHDPTVARPTTAYYRPTQQLRRVVLDPRRVVRIAPYAA